LSCKIIPIHDEKFSAAWTGGEHLSVDNMNQALAMVSVELNISIPEFTVSGVPYGSFFAQRTALRSLNKKIPQWQNFLKALLIFFIFSTTSG